MATPKTKNPSLQDNQLTEKEKRPLQSKLRIQTAEGWKRSQQKKRKLGKKENKS